MTLTCVWQQLGCERLFVAVLLCAQTGDLSMFAVAVLPFLIEKIALSTRRAGRRLERG